MQLFDSVSSAIFNRRWSTKVAKSSFEIRTFDFEEQYLS